MVMRRPFTSIVPPLFIGSTFLMPEEPSHVVISQMPTTVAPVSFAIAAASVTWSEWPWEIRIRSALFGRADAGNDGLPVYHGSNRTSFPPGVRRRNEE